MNRKLMYVKRDMKAPIHLYCSRTMISPVSVTIFQSFLIASFSSGCIVEVSIPAIEPNFQSFLIASEFITFWIPLN